ncbi:hypothetical protein SASPL_124163 [Salvia splendens]|uniref:F-box and leucine-rich repeat protein 2/20 n=1 Tax=Salvia splendens TaxID=180675 RepID=A0A8X8ZTP6_SALSN|nr:putative F-box/LRR-repeat protein 9 [Salvia splendens]KAG6416727.1 hypothetical protein SASPL_124163 [Salvia splendens]
MDEDQNYQNSLANISCSCFILVSSATVDRTPWGRNDQYSTWWKVCKDPASWRVIDFSNPRQGIFNDYYNVMCRRQGQLVDLAIQYFGNDALLDYIVHRSPNLKRIKLGTCFFISGCCARKMVAKLPHLEELHLTLRSGIGACDIEIIGKSCPMLKSFSCNGYKCKLRTYREDGYIEGHCRNLFARAISKSMPSLQHLHVFAHYMGNEGLEVILNGCPGLESLDIGDVLILILKWIWGKDVRKLNILNSLMTLLVMYRGLIAMAAIRLLLLPFALNITYTTIIAINMDLSITTSTNSEHVRHQR